jgi:hypothetical protein
MKKVIIIILSFITIVVLLMYFNVIWKSPSHYKVNKSTLLEEPIMDMKAYEDIWQTHRRPYIYSIESSKGGKVTIAGVEHTNDLNNSQFDTINKLWKEVNPSVAFVEGRMGFMFTWFMNPIEKYGESGLVSSLAKKDNISLYTWEPTRDDEIPILLKKHPADKIALFYSFRAYFSNIKGKEKINKEKELQSYLDDRTDYKHIRGIYTSWKELDSVWSNDYPNIKWRDYSTGIGWPKGYLHDIWNNSNLARDEHLIQSVIELVEKGENVFVTVGASHAPRIEKTLLKAIK